MRVNKSGVIEQFDGYFKLKEMILTKKNENGIPLVPSGMKSEDFGKTQLIKQPDVLMLIFLLSDIFKEKKKIANYDFYVSRTTHKSSLSPAMQSLIAGQAGDLHKAYILFNVALHADISNLFGNTREGIHAASIGGTWQSVVFGFAGVKTKRNDLFINPHMPFSWQSLSFSLFWKDRYGRSKR